MSERTPIESLSRDLESLLEAEKLRPEPDAAERARLLARIVSSVGPASGGGGEEGGSSGGAQSGSAPGGGALGSLLARPALLAATTFLAGALVGVAGDRALTKPTVVEPPVATIVQESVPAPARDVSPTSVDRLPDAAPVQSATPSKRPPTASNDRDLALAAERALIETAKTALGRRDDAAALDALERHVHTYPRGQLTEEREALKVQALVGAKRFDEARASAERFKKSFPSSMLMPVIDDALQKP